MNEDLFPLLIGILRNIDREALREILPRYAAAGLSALEVTMNTPHAAELIATAREQYAAGALRIGAGTVCNDDQLNQALAAGAQFIVTPVVVPSVIRSCAEQGIPVYPGAMTPTEILQAWDLGANMVKVFPAATLGPGYFRDVLAPLSHIRLLATGGMALDTLDAYWAAGVRAFGVGSPMFLPHLIAQKKWEELGNHFKRFADKAGMLSGHSSSYADH